MRFLYYRMTVSTYVEWEVVFVCVHLHVCTAPIKTALLANDHEREIVCVRVCVHSSGWDGGGEGRASGEEMIMPICGGCQVCTPHPHLFPSHSSPPSQWRSTPLITLHQRAPAASHHAN